MPAPQACAFLGTLHLCAADELLSVSDASARYWAAVDALQQRVEVRGGSENASWQVGRTRRD